MQCLINQPDEVRYSLVVIKNVQSTEFFNAYSNLKVLCFVLTIYTLKQTSIQRRKRSTFSAYNMAALYVVLCVAIVISLAVGDDSIVIKQSGQGWRWAMPDRAGNGCPDRSSISSYWPTIKVTLPNGADEVKVEFSGQPGMGHSFNVMQGNQRIFSTNLVGKFSATRTLKAGTYTYYCPPTRAV